MIEPAGPPLSLTIALLCFCGVFLLIIGVPILSILARKDAGKNDTEDKL
jgi:cytochrome c-type biogenesis protein CcmH/NrfF